MRGRGVLAGVILMIGMTPLPLPAQHLVWKESVPLCPLSDNAGFGKPLIRGRIIQSIDYSLCFSGSLFFNWTRDASVNNLLLLQDFSYECVITSGDHFSFTKKLLHQLGFQTFPDSLSLFHTDLNSLDLRLAWTMHKNHGLFLSSIFTSRLLNGYLYSADSLGHPVKIRHAGFLSPLTVTMAGGVQFVWPSLGSLQIGLSGVKLVWIMDKGIYASQKLTQCYGVDIQDDYLLEYGFSLQFQAKKKLVRWLDWDCGLLLFKMMENPLDVNFRNLFTINLTRLVKTTIQTRIFYEERVSRKVQIENVISLGISLHL